MRASTLRFSVFALVSLAVVSLAHAKETYVLDYKFGTHGAGNGQFNQPSGIAIRGNLIIVADRGNARFQAFDLQGNYVRQAKIFNGKSVTPESAAFDDSGKLYLLDSAYGRLIKCQGNFASPVSFVSAPPTGISMSNPSGIFIRGGAIFVADSSNDRIVGWNTSGVYLGNFGTHGSGDNQFSQPMTVAMDSHGDFYVADSGNRAVKKIEGMSHAFLSKWTGAGSGHPFVWPAGLCVDEADNVFVSDYSSEYVYKYAPDGTLLCVFGGEGSADGQFSTPWGMAMDAQHRLYVVDSDNDRIQRFRRNTIPHEPLTVGIAPRPALDSSTLTARPSMASDADGDALTYSYQWYKSANNTTWAAGPTTKTVAASLTTVGQYWKVKVRVFDGASYSNWTTSAAAHIIANPVSAFAAAAAQSPAGGATVTLQLASAARVEAVLLGLTGRPVATPVWSDLAAGSSDMLLPCRSTHGTRLPVGQYLLRLTAAAPDGQTQTRVLPLTLR